MLSCSQRLHHAISRKSCPSAQPRTCRHSRCNSTASRAADLGSKPSITDKASNQLSPRVVPSNNQNRRDFLLKSAEMSSLLFMLNLGTCRKADAEAAEGISIVAESEGFGKHAARDGDILLFHYVGTLEATDQVFDSTRGGLTYRDGGIGVLRPAMVKLGSGPVPGLCRGLRMGLEGMRVGGKRTVVVPAELGFGITAQVGAPYSIVPPGSVLRYDLELLRLSSRGPDELTQGMSRCGTGGASEAVQGCSDIQLAEFI